MKTFIAALFALCVAVSPAAAGANYADECDLLSPMTWGSCFLSVPAEGGETEGSESEGGASDNDSGP